MRLKFNHNSELFFPDFGLFKPNQEGEVKYESIAEDMLSTGYFDEVKETKKRKIKRKIKIKKSKKKGVDK